MLSLAAKAATGLPAPGADSQAQTIQNLNPASVSAFADTAIPAAMRDGKIPGGVFAVVRGDRVICEKAFGVADLKTGEPVSTHQTLFRVASISKILTAASALELVQTHRLDLRRNVNAYFTRFHVASAFGAPITLANLLTHSGGFDDDVFGYAARSAADKLSLRGYLVKYQPARVRPPGRFSVYDNYGFALAGYLVQKASGIPFADFVREKILAPLDMLHSSFAPDAALRRELATGYWLDGETPRACVRSYVNITPAAGLCSTAADMSDFLRALVADQRPGGGPMFPAGVLRGLETQQFNASAEVPGRCFGFDCVSIAGRQALRQTGQWPGFDSVLLLFPKQQCGLFLAYNLCDDLEMERRITRQFAEKFIPPDLNAGALAKTSGSPVEDSIGPLLGSYLSARAPHDAPELILPHEIDVRRSPDGKLEINGRPYLEIEPLVFAKIETGDPPTPLLGRRVAFRLGGDGQATRLITQSGEYRRAGWLDSTAGRMFLMSAASMIFVSAVVLWPLMAVLRLSTADTAPKLPAQSRPRRAVFPLAARGTALAACALALWFEAAFALAETRLKPFAAFYGFPAPVKDLLWSLPVLLVFTALLAAFAIVAWRKRLWHPAHRLHYTLLPVAFGVFLYLFYARHLLFIG